MADISIDEADRRLARWALWACGSSGIGYKPKASFMAIAGGENEVFPGEFYLFCESEELETDRVVAGLSAQRRALIRGRYVEHRTQEQLAKRLHVRKEDMAERLRETVEVVAARLGR